MFVVGFLTGVVVLLLLAVAFADSVIGQSSDSGNMLDAAQRDTRLLQRSHGLPRKNLIPMSLSGLSEPLSGVIVDSVKGASSRPTSRCSGCESIRRMARRIITSCSTITSTTSGLPSRGINAAQPETQTICERGLQSKKSALGQKKALSRPTSPNTYPKRPSQE